MIHEPTYTQADVAAIRALIAGTADADQQKRGMRWIVEEVCRRLDSPYQPGADGERDSVFAQGRHFVGVTIGNMTNPDAMKKAREYEQSNQPRGKK